jgi:hypothetical protein
MKEHLENSSATLAAFEILPQMCPDCQQHFLQYTEEEQILTDPATNIERSPAVNSSATVSYVANPRHETGGNPLFNPPSFVNGSQDARQLSMAGVLDPTRGLLGESANSNNLAHSNDEQQGASTQADPVALRILNMPSAQHLMEGYFTHFEYNVGFLDPELYTFDYIRQTSSFLFSVLLSVSSSIFRPELYPALRGHVESLLGRALLSCDAAIENIWAIICMYYWKETGDKRGYSLIGFAMRLAASSRWNGARQKLKFGKKAAGRRQGDELRARQERDQDRVWLYLGSLDRT